ncbi:unnamed protein product [Protopolystoma xenopodis]|uniref:Uncharacterized protein n=1 Tax=Protopolystoma xenopodis TaxID=117903 RepID=A0A448XMA2_9PLAT|nr:unnamed protein product [Protopolystoma xenopodis]
MSLAPNLPVEVISSFRALDRDGGTAGQLAYRIVLSSSVLVHLLQLDPFTGDLRPAITSQSFAPPSFPSPELRERSTASATGIPSWSWLDEMVEVWEQQAEQISAGCQSMMGETGQLDGMVNWEDGEKMQETEDSRKIRWNSKQMSFPSASIRPNSSRSPRIPRNLADKAERYSNFGTFKTAYDSMEASLKSSETKDGAWRSIKFLVEAR